MKTQKVTAVSSLSGRNVWKRSAFFLSQYSFKSLWFIADLEMCYCKIFITWWCIAFCMYFKCIHLEVLKRHFFETKRRQIFWLKVTCQTTKWLTYTMLNCLQRTILFPTLINAMHIGLYYHFETEMVMIFYIIFCKNICTLNPTKWSL